jgi:hypothetical protein
MAERTGRNTLRMPKNATFMRLLPVVLLLCACAARVPPRALAPEAEIRGNILRLAEQEWRAFGGQVVHRRADGREAIDPVGIWEDDRKGSILVARYWQRIGEGWTGLDGDKPWSAAFISWVMAEAGVPEDEMPAVATHAAYLRAAIAHGAGAHWRAHPPDAYAPRPGDLICALRAGQIIPRYDDIPPAATLHCDIVVSAGAGELQSVGGNVRNSVSRSIRLLGPDATLAGNGDRPWFLVLESLYP